MKLINTNKFYLPGTNKRFLHLATIHHSVREFMCFVDKATTQVYIEEITGGTGPHLIEDESLVQGLSDFLVYNGVLDHSKPLLPDNEWLSNKNED